MLHDTNDQGAEDPAPIRRWGWRRWLAWGLVLLILTVGLGAWGFSSFLHFMLAVPLAGAFGPVAFLFLLDVSGHSSRPTYGRGRAAVRWFVICTSVAVVAGGSLFTGRYFHKLYMRSAQAWCESRVLHVEAFRGTHGRYPESLQELEPGGEIPWTVDAFYGAILAGRDGYCFDLSTGLFSGYSYTPARGTWVHYR